MLIKYFSLSIIIHSTSNTFKVLRRSTVVKSQSIEYLHGPHTLDRAYIEHEKACIVKYEVKKLNKVVKAKKQAI